MVGAGNSAQASFADLTRLENINTAALAAEARDAQDTTRSLLTWR